MLTRVISAHPDRSSPQYASLGYNLGEIAPTADERKLADLTDAAAPTAEALVLASSFRRACAPPRA